MKGTSTGDGGWGSAAGNNSRSNSGWFGTDLGAKSVNPSTADLLRDGSNTSPTSRHAPAEIGESQLPPLMGKALPVETQGPEEVAHTREHLMARTDVPLVADAATAGPTTAGNSPEGGGEGIEKAAHDEWDDWDIPVKKGGTNAGIATIPSGDDWAILGAGGKKKKKRK
ncbi:hypothetical protein EDB92DRAFT_1538437 [Lactarius akahatsu]|uniref:Uncharacterized protein n=1 Tax=Lactarius akahatsu TaxID=416441 RepID=A0AAD4LRZ3_9AGAM|nr:hypothetical protein EDB92DRAFT_1538437 [Lactarius akahatsu]